MDKEDEMHQGSRTTIIPKQTLSVTSNAFNVHSKYNAADMAGEK